jgi:predicted RNA-binding Zn ribbon-like protein
MAPSSSFVSQQKRAIFPTVRKKKEYHSICAPATQFFNSLNDELGKVKKCADTDCGWLFLDMSRNRSRRWCDMKSCGNRAKARRYYKRKQNVRS